MRIKIKKQELGFTIIELLISMAVLAGLITALVILIDPPGQFKKARDAQRKSDLSQIQKALEQYYQDKGSYPVHDATTYQIIDGNPPAVKLWGGGWSPYMNVLPKDPKTTVPVNKYVYFRTANGQSYYLYASLERGTLDPQACFANGNACTSAGSNGVSTACGGNCNYGVSSPDQTP